MSSDVRDGRGALRMEETIEATGPRGKWRENVHGPSIAKISGRLGLLLVISRREDGSWNGASDNRGQ